MATTVRQVPDPAAALAVVRELGGRPGAVEAAERMLGDSSATSRILEAGWRRPEGVLVVGAGTTPGGERPALVAAANERALRDLLLAIPHGERLCLQAAADWHLGAIAEILDGAPAPDRGGCFAGVKRGGAAAGPGGGDRLLDRRDALVPLLRALGQPDGRERHGRFVAEGPTLVRRALDDGLPVDAIVHRSDLGQSPGGRELLETARAAGIGCWRASEGLMGTFTATRPLPEVLAVVHLRLRDAAGSPRPRASTVLVAENLQNPDNLGMVLRTADAAGVEAVVVAGETTDPLHRNCVRAARGAVGRIPIFRCTALPAWIAELRGDGFRVAGATAHGDVGLFDAELAAPIAIVVGNEEVGISREVRAACTSTIAIPMAPGQDSLNVGVAAGVVLFELLRRRDAADRRRTA